MSDDDDERDWIEVRRVADPVSATMVRDFLHDHDVPTALRGNTGVARLPWSPVTMDIRIVVAPSDVEKAAEILLALEAERVVEQPFRGRAPGAAAMAKPTDEEVYSKPRSAVAAAVLAFIVPIGAGHFYARHSAAGTILCAAIIGAALGATLGGRVELVRAWAALVVLDAALAVLAVRRTDAGRVPSDASQRAGALVVVIVAFLIAWLSG